MKLRNKMSGEEVELWDLFVEAVRHVRADFVVGWYETKPGMVYPFYHHAWWAVVEEVPDQAEASRKVEWAQWNGAEVRKAGL